MGGPGSGPTKRTRKEAAERRKAIIDAWLADPNCTLESVGKQFGITRERVRQIVTDSPDPPRARVERRKIATVERGKRRKVKAKAEEAGRLMHRCMAREDRRELISQMWLAGMSSREIAPKAGLKGHASLSQYINRQRKNGYIDMFPFRNSSGGHH